MTKSRRPAARRPKTDLDSVRADLQAAEARRAEATQRFQADPSDRLALRRKRKAAEAIEELTIMAAELEAQGAERHRADLLAQAHEYVFTTIPNERAKLDAQYAQAAAAALVTLLQVKQDVGTLNTDYRRLWLKAEERAAVAKRFGLKVPALPALRPPVHLPEVRAALFEVQTAVGLLDHRRETERETRRLIADTPGGKLIAEAGPSDEERREAEEVAARDAEKKVRDAEAATLIAPLAEEIEAMRNLPLYRRL